MAVYTIIPAAIVGIGFWVGLNIFAGGFLILTALAICVVGLVER
jgi:hypothetical protein